MAGPFETEQELYLALMRAVSRLPSRPADFVDFVTVKGKGSDFSDGVRYRFWLDISANPTNPAT